MDPIIIVDMQEAQWLCGQCARLWFKWSGFESLQGALLYTVFLHKKTLDSNRAFLRPGV